MTTDTDPRVERAMELAFDYVRAWDRVRDCTAPRAALKNYLAAEFAKVPSAPEAVAWEWRTTGTEGWVPCSKEGFAHFSRQPGCEGRALGVLVTTPPQAAPSMSKSWQTAVAVAREATSGRTVADSAVILAIDKRLSEAFTAAHQDKPSKDQS